MEEVRCAQCETVFERDTRTSSAFRILLVVFIILFLFVLWVAFFVLR
jgi:predicted nucleic acid-binding Zn ribbon protein